MHCTFLLLFHFLSWVFESPRPPPVVCFWKRVAFAAGWVHFHLQELTSGLSSPLFFPPPPCHPLIISSLSWLHFASLTCDDVTTFWQQILPSPSIIFSHLSENCPLLVSASHSSPSGHFFLSLLFFKVLIWFLMHFPAWGWGEWDWRGGGRIWECSQMIWCSSCMTIRT